MYMCVRDLCVSMCKCDVCVHVCVHICVCECACGHGHVCVCVHDLCAGMCKCVQECVFVCM